MMKRNAYPECLASQFHEEVQELLGVLAHGDLSEPLRECANLARQDFAENFAAQAGPHSGAWAPRKKDGSGKIGEAGSGHPLEIKSGALFLAETSDFGAGAITEIGRREATLGVDPDVIPYAAAQNYGHTYDNPLRVLPQRESFDIRDATADRCLEMVADAALEQLSF